MNEQKGNAGGKQIGLGIFVFVVVALCATAILGTGIHFGAGDVSQNFAPESPAAQLADTVIALDLDPELSDAVLKQMLQVVLDRATAGDIEAAAFVFTLAARQRGITPELVDAPSVTPRSEETAR